MVFSPFRKSRADYLTGGARPRVRRARALRCIDARAPARDALSLACRGARPSAPRNPQRSLAMPPTPPPPATTAAAVLGGGCFWCLEAVFDELDGVLAVESGYAGGSRPDPTYEEVCRGDTGHAEVVRVTFDPAVLSFRDLLLVFFTIHDPTTRDRQGYDVGTQYRSVIFCLTPEQRQTAEAVVAELEAAKLWTSPIVTEIAGPAPFHEAEGYHQEYFSRNGEQPYCEAVVAPKVAKFRRQWSERLKRKARG